MDKNLTQIKIEVYDNLQFEISDYKKEQESKGYDACRFKLNGKDIISRSGKITPKKEGQFVTFWERNEKGITQPINKTEPFDFYIINVLKQNQLGQFVFPKSVLIKKGIVSTQKKEGKRGFRVYPIWDKTTSKQAKKTQQWQLDYFYQINDTIDFNTVVKLYKNT